MGFIKIIKMSAFIISIIFTMGVYFESFFERELLGSLMFLALSLFGMSSLIISHFWLAKDKENFPKWLEYTLKTLTVLALIIFVSTPLVNLN